MNDSSTHTSPGPKMSQSVRPNKKLTKASKKVNNAKIQVTAPLHYGTIISNNFSETPYRIKRREFIGNIANVNTGFLLSKRLRVNPGSQNTFPWLSQVASGFERFRFKTLKFMFIHRVAATSSGVLLMVPDYDSADTVPQTEAQATSYAGATEFVIWNDFTMTLPGKDLNRSYTSHYIMEDSRFDSTEQDSKTIDPAQVFLFTDVDFSGTSLGKLWVEYDVELMNPQTPILPPSLGGGSMSMSLNNVSNSVNPITAIPLTNPALLGQQIANVNLNTMTLSDAQRTVLSSIGVNTTYPSGILMQALKPILSNFDIGINLPSGGAMSGLNKPEILTVDGSLYDAVSAGIASVIDSGGRTSISQNYLTNPTLSVTDKEPIKQGDLVLIRNPNFSSAPVTTNGFLNMGGIFGY